MLQEPPAREARVRLSGAAVEDHQGQEQRSDQKKLYPRTAKQEIRRTLAKLEVKPLASAEAELARNYFQWLKENLIFEEVFGETIHSEIVKRALPLLKFFAKNDGLNAE